MRLEKWTFVRQTSLIGQFSLYSQVYYLGKAYARQYVAAKFKAETNEWQLFDAKGVLIKAVKAKNIDKQSIRNLTVNQRTNKK